MFLLGLLKCEADSVLDVWCEEKSGIRRDSDLRTEGNLMKPESSETSSDAVCRSEADFKAVAGIGAKSHGNKVR